MDNSLTNRQSIDIASALATNLIQARRSRRYSQAQVAQRAGVPRSTLSHLESGAGNPSLKTLAAIADALGIGLDELISAPRSRITLMTAEEIPSVTRSAGTVEIWKLLPDRVKGLEIDRLELQPRATMRGTPHLPGTREYLHVISGQVQVLLAGEFHEVAEGGVLAFPGDQHHSYRNGHNVVACALSVVVPRSAD